MDTTKLVAVLCVIVIGRVSAQIEQPDLGDRTEIYSFRIALEAIVETTTTTSTSTTPEITTEEPHTTGTTVISTTDSESLTTSETPDSSTDLPQTTQVDTTTDVTGTEDDSTDNVTDAEPSAPARRKLLQISSTEEETKTTSLPQADLIPLLQEFLVGQFNWTTGYLSLKIQTLESNSQVPTYTYDVTYDLAVLSNKSALGNPLIEEFNEVQANITSSDDTFGDYQIDVQSTSSIMSEDINNAKAQMTDTCSSLGAICNNIEFACDLQNGALICENKCVLFDRGFPQCTSPPAPSGVYLTGECTQLNGNPSCNCGKSAGDVMSNFWDGSKCISVTFIVCIGAALGGSIIVILLSLVIWLATERKRMSSDSRSSSDTTPINGYGKGPDYPTQAYDNAAYDVDPEIRSSQAYQAFSANLQSVDTTTTYQIKRPTVKNSENNSYTREKSGIESAYL